MGLKVCRSTGDRIWGPHSHAHAYPRGRGGPGKAKGCSSLRALRLYHHEKKGVFALKRTQASRSKNLWEGDSLLRAYPPWLPAGGDM